MAVRLLSSMANLPQHSVCDRLVQLPAASGEPVGGEVLRDSQFIVADVPPTRPPQPVFSAAAGQGRGAREFSPHERPHDSSAGARHLRKRNIEHTARRKSTPLTLT